MYTTWAAVAAATCQGPSWAYVQCCTSFEQSSSCHYRCTIVCNRTALYMIMRASSCNCKGLSIDHVGMHCNIYTLSTRFKPAAAAISAISPNLLSLLHHPQIVGLDNVLLICNCAMAPACNCWPRLHRDISKSHPLPYTSCSSS